MLNYEYITYVEKLAWSWVCIKKTKKMKFPQGVTSKWSQAAICFSLIMAGHSEWIMVPINYLCFFLSWFSYIKMKEIYFEIRKPYFFINLSFPFPFPFPI